jgi:hypothetical protein
MDLIFGVWRGEAREIVDPVGGNALVVALLSLTAMVALADPITVDNPSFETLPSGGLTMDSCGAGCFFSVNTPIPS